MGTNTGHVMTLANSIIGVSVLAMPFCFKQCGIVLAALMLLLSNIMSRLSCHYILKSAILSRRRTFEFLAFHVFGPTGKLTVELSIIGFMLGTCVAFFVVVGDLGPAIIAPALNLETPSSIRPTVLIALALFVVLPLGLLRNVESLTAVSVVTIAFYLCLVLKVMLEALSHLIAWDWLEQVNLWRPIGILQCLPIFSMALSCQTQLFEIFESLPNTSLDKMNSVVRSAINMCTGMYMTMGLFGYIAFCNQPFTGNVMMSFSQSAISELIKLGFVLSVAVSFPLVIFPCRASLHSLLFRRGQTPHYELMGASNYIPEQRFQCITILIITVSLITGLIIPNIELVLGLVGSTIGILICVMVPALMYICLTNKNNNERLLAQVLFIVGLMIMILGTYANLYATEEAMSGPELGPAKVVPVSVDPPSILNMESLPNQDNSEPKLVVQIKDETLKDLKNVEELAALPELKKENSPTSLPIIPVIQEGVNKEIRKEPPIPEAPVAVVVSERAPLPQVVQAEVKKVSPKINVERNNQAVNNEKKEETIDKEAIKKEENEIKEVKQIKEDVKMEQDMIDKVVKEDIKKEKKKELLEKYVKNEEEKQKINEEQKKILEEIKEENKKDKFKEDTKSAIDTNVDKIQNEVIKDNKGNLPEDKISGVIAKVKDNSEINDGLNMNDKMLKRIPLPIAVQDNLKEKNEITAVKEVDQVDAVKVEEIVNDKVLRREILENKIPEVKEDRTKRDTDSLVISYSHDKKDEDNFKQETQNDEKENKIINDKETLQIVEKKNDIFGEANITKSNKTFAQLLKDNKRDENEQCNDEKLKQKGNVPIVNIPKQLFKDDATEEKNVTKGLVNESLSNQAITNDKSADNINKPVQTKTVELKSSLDKKTVTENEVKDGVTDSLIKTPAFLSNPDPILQIGDVKPNIQLNNINEIKPMKRDLKFYNSEEHEEVKDRET